MEMNEKRNKMFILTFHSCMANILLMSLLSYYVWRNPKNQGSNLKNLRTRKWSLNFYFYFKFLPFPFPLKHVEYFIIVWESNIHLISTRKIGIIMGRYDLTLWSVICGSFPSTTLLRDLFIAKHKFISTDVQGSSLTKFLDVARCK